MKTMSPTIIAFFIFGLLFLSFLSIYVTAFEDSETNTVHKNLTPVADAYVDPLHPDENKGSHSLLVENFKFRGTSSIFIKFDLSSIPTEAIIVSAQLKMYAGTVLNGGDVSAYYILDDSWREHGLTYNNRPTLNSTTRTYIVEDVSAHSWYSWDITEDVVDAFHDDKILTEALMWENTTEYGLIYFRSKESDSSPKLKITYTIPTTPTPTLPTTPIPTPKPSATPVWEKVLTDPRILGACVLITAIVAIIGVILQITRKRQR